jgi:hypothetical protein
MSTKIEIIFYLSMLPRYLFLKIFCFLFDVENVSIEIVILYSLRSWGGVLDTTLCDKVYQ